MKLPTQPVFIELCVGQELVWIYLDLVGADSVPQTLKILAVRIEIRAEQIGHPVKHDLESGCPEQRGGLASALHVMAAPVQFQDPVVKTLGPHLHLGDAQVSQPADLVRSNLIRSCFDHQAHVPV
jgi:hypothetical protein